MAEHLEDYQFRYRGLVFGAYTGFGVDEVEGISSLIVRSGSKEFPRGHGSVPGKHFAEGLPLSFSVHIDPTADLGSYEDSESKLSTLKDVLRVYEDFDADRDRLEFKLPGQSILMKYVRPIAIPIVRTPVPSMSFRLVFENADPRTYSVDAHTASITVYDPASGMDYTKEYSTDFLGGAGGDITIVNTGNASAYPVVNFYGPTSGANATEVRLDNLTNGDYIHIVTAITPGQILTADMEAVVVAVDRLPIHIGGASRYGGWQLPRKPLRLSSGDNVLRFTAVGNTTGMRAVVTWRDTSL